MSFGFSVGDFVAVGQLAWQVYRKCKNATSEFQVISSQLLTLHLAIKDVNDTIEEGAVPEAKRNELLQIIEDANEALNELDEQVKKFSSLGMKSSRAFERLRYPRAAIQELRGRIESYIHMLNSFKTSPFVISSSAREDGSSSHIRAKRRPTRRISHIPPIDCCRRRWRRRYLARHKQELEDYGTITDAVLSEHRDFIITLLKSAFADEDDNMSALVEEVSEAGTPRQAMSCQGIDDDVSDYLADHLYDALSFYEMFCDDPAETQTESQNILSLKLHLLGRQLKALQQLSFTNTEFWNLALSKTITEVKQALALIVPIIDSWISTNTNDGLWELSITRLSRLKCRVLTPVIGGEDRLKEDNDILIIKENLQIVRAAMQIKNSQFPVRKVMNQ